MSALLDNLRRIGRELTESELPSQNELREVIGALVWAGNPDNDPGILDGTADDRTVDKAIDRLRRLKLPLNEQGADDNTTPGNGLTVETDSVSREEFEAMRARAEAAENDINAARGRETLGTDELPVGTDAEERVPDSTVGRALRDREQAHVASDPDPKKEGDGS